MALGWWAIDARADARTARGRIDVPGLALSVVALFTLTYALIEGHDKGWTSSLIMGSFAVSALAAIAFVVVELRSNDPMVHVSLFADRVFTGGMAAIVMWGFGLFGIYFFTSLYLQNVLGFSATKAGAAFVPMALLMAVGAVLSERVARVVGPHRSVGAAMALMALGIGTVSLLGAHAGYLSLMPSFALIGIGGGLSVPLTAMVLGTMPADKAGVASGIFNAGREVAGLLGITVIGAILTARQGVALNAGHAPVDAFLSGYRAGLLVAAALVAIGGVAAFLALRDTTPDLEAGAQAEFALAG
jgi:predicted MFS family arabinose efflux permease